MKTYMGLYTAIHNFCTAQKAVAGSSFAANNNRGGAHLLGEDLYQHLIEYLKTHLAGVQAESRHHVDEALLTFYIKEWNRYTTAGQYNNHLFRYLNRHWVKREMDEGKKNIYDIYTLHLVRWKDDMFLGTQESVMRSVLKLVEKQRNGETIEQGQIKSVVDSFVSLGLDESDSSKSTLDVYKEYFEKPFLAATAEYYDNESKQFLAENSPKSVRGSMTATYNLMIVTSLMLAFWVNYGVSLWSYPGIHHDNTQWRVSMSTFAIQ